MKILKKFAIVLLLSGACGLQAAHSGHLSEQEEPFYQLGPETFGRAPMTEGLRRKITVLATRAKKDPRTTYNELIRQQQQEHYSHLEHDLTATAYPLGNLIDQEHDYLDRIERPTDDQLRRASDMQLGDRRKGSSQPIDFYIDHLRKQDEAVRIEAETIAYRNKVEFEKRRKEQEELEAAAQREVRAAETARKIKEDQFKMPD